MQQMQRSGEQTAAPVETAEEKKTLVTEEILPDEQAKDRTEETKAPDETRNDKASDEEEEIAGAALSYEDDEEDD